MKTLLSVLSLSLFLAAIGSAAPEPPVNEKCPVCDKAGRLIFHSNYQGKRIIFASADCKDKFDKAPTKYPVKAK